MQLRQARQTDGMASKQNLKKIVFSGLRHSLPTIAHHRSSPSVKSHNTLLHINNHKIGLALPSQTCVLKTKMAFFLSAMTDSVRTAVAKDCDATTVWTTVMPTDFATYFPQPTTFTIASHIYTASADSNVTISST